MFTVKKTISRREREEKRREEKRREEKRGVTWRSDLYHLRLKLSVRQTFHNLL
jgi:hypothetical protein